jgi:hypothetical protein
VVHWGSEGGAVLSLPTKEYFQSSGWVEDRPPPSQTRDVNDTRLGNGFGGISTEVRSVRSGSDFWAGGRSRTPSSHAFTAGSHSRYLSDTDESLPNHHHTFLRNRSHTRQGQGTNESSQYTHTTTEEHDDDNDSQDTETPHEKQDHIVDELGSQDAFIAGMIYALSRKMCPGLPYTPAWSGEDDTSSVSEDSRGRWKLDECLRCVLIFAFDLTFDGAQGSFLFSV